MECVIWGLVCMCVCVCAVDICLVAVMSLLDYKGNYCFDWLLIPEDMGQMCV